MLEEKISGRDSSITIQSAAKITKINRKLLPCIFLDRMMVWVNRFDKS
jgi:hypothetical protein